MKSDFELRNYVSISRNTNLSNLDQHITNIGY